jgi:ABC-type lipoprotein release transport system permease subunit
MKRISFWLRVAVLFLVRSGRVTLVLALMIFSAVAALVFLSSLATGVNDAMIRNSVGLYTGHISGDNLPASVAPEMLQVGGVTRVLRRGALPGMLSVGQRLVPVTLMVVVPEAEVASTGLPRKIVDGTYLAPASDQILLSAYLAEQLGVTTGATLSFVDGRAQRDYEFTVCGIYRTEVDRLDYGIAFVADKGREIDRDTWQAAIFIEAGVPPERVKARLEKSVPGNAVFQSWLDRMPDLRQLIDLNYISMTLVTILVFSVVAIGVACAFVMFVLKNIREYGIMRSMGVTVGDMAWLIGGEILLLSSLASLLGVLAGSLVVALVAHTGIDLTALTSHNRYFTVSGMVYPRATGYALGIPPIVAVGFSLLASIWPIALIGRKKVADILRIV